jgi:hypothetical protein
MADVAADERTAPMHALLITFTTAASLEELAESSRAYGEALLDVPGLVSKTWINEGHTLGGFYVFEHRADADAYLAGDLWATIETNPAFSGFTKSHFDVIAVTAPVPARRASA